MGEYKLKISLFFLLSIIRVSPNVVERMKIYTYKVELFQNFMQAEQQAYKFLCAKPIEKDVNYLAVPWGRLFKQNNLQVKLPKKLNGGFTICQHIRYRDIISVLRRLGINILFAPHAPKKQQYKDVTVLPFPLYPIHGTDPAKEKDVLYSFIGLETHPLRKKIFGLPLQRDIIIKKRRFVREQEIKEFQDILARSRFSLCPRGFGPSTYRFWESLQAGAIPVLLADTMALPKIEGLNWDDCIVRVPEKNVSSVDQIIRNISPEKEEAMRENCLQAFELSCAGNNFVQTIRNYFEETV